MSNNWFDVDRKGLAQLIEDRGKVFLLHELIANAWDGHQVRLSDEEKDEIRRMYLAGIPSRVLIAKYGPSQSAFALIVKGLHREVKRANFEAQLKRIEALPDRDKGWIAGIIDGEGWIGITAGKRGRVPRVSVASTTPAMQNKLRRLIGGHVYLHRREQYDERDYYNWNLWSAGPVLALLIAIGPLLVVKKRVAVVVACFCRRRLDGNRDRGRDERDQRQVNDLNRKGRRK